MASSTPPDPAGRSGSDRGASAGTTAAGWIVRVLAALIALSAVALAPSVARSRLEPREIVLVARDMAFYVEGDATPNPIIRATAGETLRLVLRNEDSGVTHNFAIEAWDVRIGPLKGAGSATRLARVPDRAGRYEYVCTPHAQMMRGHVDVSR